MQLTVAARGAAVGRDVVAGREALPRVAQALGAGGAGVLGGRRREGGPIAQHLFGEVRIEGEHGGQQVELVVPEDVAAVVGTVAALVVGERESPDSTICLFVRIRYSYSIGSGPQTLARGPNLARGVYSSGPHSRVNKTKLHNYLRLSMRDPDEFHYILFQLYTIKTGD